MSAKSDLHRVSLCAADCVTPDLARRALTLSANACDFAEVILFSDTAQDEADGIHTIAIDKLCSRDDYSRFIMKDMVQHIHGDYALIVQWDGYVVTPQAWQPAFLDYDYIGARWPWHKDGFAVGNGGFSLRSRRLLECVSTAKLQLVPGEPEDHQICRLYAQALTENDGIRFAPETVADAFSYERTLPDAPTFGFHGLFNMWRHLEDAEMMVLAEQIAPHSFLSRDYFELTLQYFLLRKFGPLSVLYRRMRARHTIGELRPRILAVIPNEALIDGFFSRCEALYPQPQ